MDRPLRKGTRKLGPLVNGEQARMEKVTQRALDEYQSPGHPIRFMESMLREEQTAWKEGLQHDAEELVREHREANPTASAAELDALRKGFEARHTAAMDIDGYKAMDAVMERTMRQNGVDQDTVKEVLRPIRAAAESRENERENMRDRSHVNGR